MRPTFRKVYRSPGTGTSKVFATCNVAIITGGTKGTMFEDMDSKLANTAPMKARFAALKKHGFRAMQKTLKNKRYTKWSKKK